ncbi:beta-N-acetylhexosaminidase [Lautropia dentalis]|jgi:Beta-glucosidase-related glycosidases|uniref:beta-N-acetylhexosaminidase n=1 Tax=Lautropia dentalis TaxID=2490857 RepID=UPI00193AA39B|nr:beta-N-acetylhexosaminidase [Lautropia dentalis]
MFATSAKPLSRRSRNLPPGPVVVDVQGLHLTDAERRRLRHPLVGGVILFARNYQSPGQLRALTDEIHACRTPPLLVAVDHEGGRVQRFREGFSAIPAMRTLGERWDQDVLAACREATDIGRKMGEELRAVGVDFTFAPVLDLDWGRSSVIGTRAFHSDPRVVAMLARCLTHGLLLAGMANCGKHFPGHGFADADSHVAMPVDERSLDEILADDAAPYAWLGAALTAVMPAHVIYPQVDRKPAGFSKRWLQTILRRRLGFDGLIFSDDLTMEAATVAGGITARATAALKAGCDMVLVCNRPDLADELLASLEPPANPHLQRRLDALRPRVMG